MRENLFVFLRANLLNVIIPRLSISQQISLSIMAEIQCIWNLDWFHNFAIVKSVQ